MSGETSSDRADSCLVDHSDILCLEDAVVSTGLLSSFLLYNNAVQIAHGLNEHGQELQPSENEISKGSLECS